jgi:hypothetical protein
MIGDLVGSVIADHAAVSTTIYCRGAGTGQDRQHSHHAVLANYEGRETVPATTGVPGFLPLECVVLVVVVLVVKTTATIGIADGRIEFRIRQDRRAP